MLQFCVCVQAIEDVAVRHGGRGWVVVLLGGGLAHQWTRLAGIWKARQVVLGRVAAHPTFCPAPLFFFSVIYKFARVSFQLFWYVYLFSLGVAVWFLISFYFFLFWFLCGSVYVCVCAHASCFYGWCFMFFVLVASSSGAIVFVAFAVSMISEACCLLSQNPLISQSLLVKIEFFARTGLLMDLMATPLATKTWVRHTEHKSGVSPGYLLAACVTRRGRNLQTSTHPLIQDKRSYACATTTKLLSQNPTRA